MSKQLPLRIGPRGHAAFNNFYAAANFGALAAMRSAKESFVYVWGPPGSGRTHLLLAACRAAADARLGVAYLDLGEVLELGVGVLEGLEDRELVCVDDVERIAGRHDWEDALFHLFNRTRDTAARLRIAGSAAPHALGLGLPDLESRLNWGPVFHLRPLDDEGKLRALTLHALSRGLQLPDDVGRYLLRHGARDTPLLFATLDRLDHASMAAKRRLTIPFVKQTLGI